MIGLVKREFAGKGGIAHAVAVCSGTAAMPLAMRVLGVGAGKDPNYLPLAQKAFDQARRLRPYAPRGHLGLGIVELAAYARKSKGNEGDSWKQAFGGALSLDPSLLPRVLDQMIFYLGQEGLKDVREVLPGDASGYLRAGEYLLKQGFHESGLKILAEGEEKRGQDVGKLWAAFHQGGKGAVRVETSCGRSLRGSLGWVFLA